MPQCISEGILLMVISGFTRSSPNPGGRVPASWIGLPAQEGPPGLYSIGGGKLKPKLSIVKPNPSSGIQEPLVKMDLRYGLSETEVTSLYITILQLDAFTKQRNKGVPFLEALQNVLNNDFQYLRPAGNPNLPPAQPPINPSLNRLNQQNQQQLHQWVNQLGTTGQNIDRAMQQATTSLNNFDRDIASIKAQYDRSIASLKQDIRRNTQPTVYSSGEKRSPVTDEAAKLFSKLMQWGRSIDLSITKDTIIDNGNGHPMLNLELQYQDPNTGQLTKHTVSISADIATLRAARNNVPGIPFLKGWSLEQNQLADPMTVLLAILGLNSELPQALPSVGRQGTSAGIQASSGGQGSTANGQPGPTDAVMGGQGPQPVKPGPRKDDAVLGIGKDLPKIHNLNQLKDYILAHGTIDAQTIYNETHFNAVLTEAQKDPQWQIANKTEKTALLFYYLMEDLDKYCIQYRITVPIKVTGLINNLPILQDNNITAISNNFIDLDQNAYGVVTISTYGRFKLSSEFSKYKGTYYIPPSLRSHNEYYSGFSWTKPIISH